MSYKKLKINLNENKMIAYLNYIINNLNN